MSALGQLDQSVDRSAEGADRTELAPTALGKRIYEAESDASSSIKSDESSALDRYPNYLQNQDSTVSDYSYLYTTKAEFDKPNTDEGAVEIKASTKPLLVYNATEEEPKRPRREDRHQEARPREAARASTEHRGHRRAKEEEGGERRRPPRAAPSRLAAQPR